MFDGRDADWWFVDRRLIGKGRNAIGGGMTTRRTRFRPDHSGALSASRGWVLLWEELEDQRQSTIRD